MANDFSGDSDCKALWRLESGALGTDSKGGNDLTPVNTPTEDTVDYKEGSCCGVFVEASNQRLYIADADLDAGFPLKNGDTTKLISFSCWFKPDTIDSYCVIVGKKDWANSKVSLALCITNAGLLFVSYGYQAGQYELADGIASLTADRWYHATVIVDGSSVENAKVKVRLYDSVTETATTYGWWYPNWALYVTDVAWAIAGSYGGTDPFDGKVDEVVVFDRLLTEDEADEIRSGTYGAISGINVEATTDSLAITTYDATVQNIISIGCSAASLSLTENQAFVEYPTNIQAGIDTLSLATHKASITGIDINVLADVVNLTLQTFGADIVFDASIQADVANLVLQTYEADIDIDVNVQTALASLALNPYAANINARINVQADYDELRLKTLHSMVTAPQSIFRYGDWRDYKGDRTWPNNFVEQPNKWGYLNNPRWQTAPVMPPVNYTGDEANEPQVWSLPGQGYSSGASKKHIPCGHWHKKKVGQYEGQVYVSDVTWSHVYVYTLYGLLIRVIDGATVGFVYPTGVWVYEDEVYIISQKGVADTRKMVIVTDLFGTWLREWEVEERPVGEGAAQGGSVQLNSIYCYEDKVYVAEHYGQCINVYTTSGTLLNVLNSPCNGTTVLYGQVQQPHFLKIYEGEFYCALVFTIEVMNPTVNGSQTPIRDWGDAQNADNNHYWGLKGICFFDNKCYAGDQAEGGRVRVTDCSGNYISKFGITDTLAYGLDGYEDEIYIANRQAVNSVQVFSLTGTLNREWPITSTGAPSGICVYAHPV